MGATSRGGCDKVLGRMRDGQANMITPDSIRRRRRKKKHKHPK